MASASASASSTTDAAAADDDYMAFLNKANESSAAPPPAAQAQASSQEQQQAQSGFKTSDADIPRVLASANFQERFYVSDADEAFEPVSFAYTSSSHTGALDISTFFLDASPPFASALFPSLSGHSHSLIQCNI